MGIKKTKFSAGKLAVCALLSAVMVTSGICGAASLNGFADDSAEMYFNKIAAFDTGNTDADGGTAEIVHYNSDNNKMYLVNGADQSIDIISLESYGSDEAQTVFDENTDRVKISDIVAENPGSFADGFEVGDISSVAVSTDLKVIAVAVQHSDYSAEGAVVLLDYDGSFVAAYGTGVQPDNVCISGNYILTADEGEPREGYTSGTDPKGSVTIVSGLSENNLTGGTAKQVYFDDFDEQRDELTADGVIIMKDANPSTDFEPEYIVSSGNGYAYVSLQEANAIAVLDIAKGEFTAVQSLGFKNYNEDGNKLDLIEDGLINIKNEDVYGVYMPDGMDIYTADDGTTYLITANEGDAREWGEFSGVKKVAMTDENGENSTKVEVLNNDKWDGLDEDKTYVLGGRSFSVFKVTGSSVEMVYDSGDGIEQTIAASDYSAYFNCNNDDVSLDARSRKKGPEPEDATVYEYNGKVCVSVCLERQSGFVTFDITDVLSGSGTAAESLGYTTTRDFTANMAGDVAPENLEYVAASENALGKDLIIMANENSGTVSVYAIESTAKTYELHSEYTEAENSETQSTEGSVLITSYFATGDNADGAFNYSFVTIYNNSGEELDISGWTIQYKSSRDSSSSNWQSFTLETVLDADGTYTVVCAGASGTYSNSVTLTSSNYDAVWSDLAYFDNKTASIKIVDADGNTVDALGIYCADESYSASNEEGEGNLVDDISKNKVIYRNSSNGVYTDTDDNSADFSVSSKLNSASKASAYTPAANANAQATAYIALDCENAEVSGIEYLSSGYVLAGDITFTVTPETGYKVASVMVDDTEITATEGVYSLTLSGDCEITVTCESVYTFELNADGETYTITGLNDDSVTEVIIPSEYNGAAVTAIAASAFKNNTAITSLYIPESITSIGNYAFYGCSNLAEIYYGAASVTLEASNYVFYKAGQSGEGIAVTIGNTVEQIPAYLFNPYGVSASYAPKITSVTFEADSICTSVGDRAFAFCASLTSIDFPDSVQTFGTYVFYGCSALKSVSFGSGVTTIGANQFASCTSLESVTFANTFGWYKGQSTTLTNNGYAVCVGVSDDETNAANFTASSGGWLSYKLIRTDNVLSYYVDGELYGAACYLTSITAKQVTNLKKEISVTTVPSKTCYSGEWDTSVTYKTLQSGGAIDVNAVYTANHTLENTAAAAATCTQDGNTEYWYCTVCEKYFSDENGETEITLEDTVIAATGHTESEAVIENEIAATCTADGSYDTVIYCSVCGEEISRETVTVPATGHNYESVVTAPTCTEGGYTTYTCTVCGDSYVSDETEATGHTAGETVTENEVAATCTTDGSYDSVVYCTVCGEEISRETVTVPATGHNYESVVTAPTCTEKGYTTYTCTICGDSYKADETEATGHDYESAITAPTCTEGGYTTYTCTVCGDSYVGDETEATGHDYESVVTAPTCTEKGYTTYTCTICGDSYVGDETEALGHSYTSAITAPTCTEKGYTTYTCTICGDSYVGDETEATGHNYESVVTAPTCTEKGYTTYTCTICGDSYVGDETEATGHKYTLTSWTWDGVENATALLTCEIDGHTETAIAEITSEITTAATETTEGVITYTATITFEGETYTVTKAVAVPATGTSESTDSSDESTDVNTGEETDSSDGSDGGSDGNTDDITNADGSGCATFFTGGGSSFGGDLGILLAAFATIAFAVILRKKRAV